MGVPWHEAPQTGALMGTKLVANEFVAYPLQLKPIIEQNLLSEKTVAIVGCTLWFCQFRLHSLPDWRYLTLEPKHPPSWPNSVRALIAGTWPVTCRNTGGGNTFE